MKNNKLIVVLGMHRSGTSLITKSLELMGVGLGSDLLPAGEPNPKGYWENQECIEINNRLLEHLDSRWDQLGLASQQLMDKSLINELKARAIELISRQLNQNNGIFGLKDPRICRLLVFWKEVFLEVNCDINVIVTVRNPASVAVSLEKRDGIPTEKSYFLWLQHVLPALVLLKDIRHIFVDYDQFLENPYAEMLRISSMVELPLPDFLSDSFKNFQNDFLESTLRHAQFTEDELKSDARAPRMMVEAYRLVHRLAKDQPTLGNSNEQTLCEELNNRLAEITPIFGYINTLENNIADLKTEVHQRDILLAKQVDIIDVQANAIVNQAKILDEQAKRFAEIFASFSWRVTRPLRGVARLVRKIKGE